MAWGRAMGSMTATPRARSWRPWVLRRPPFTSNALIKAMKSSVPFPALRGKAWISISPNSTSDQGKKGIIARQWRSNGNFGAGHFLWLLHCRSVSKIGVSPGARSHDRGLREYFSHASLDRRKRQSSGVPRPCNRHAIRFSDVAFTDIFGWGFWGKKAAPGYSWGSFSSSHRPRF